MTVQELINELDKIEDKEQVIYVDKDIYGEFEAELIAYEIDPEKGKIIVIY